MGVEESNSLSGWYKAIVILLLIGNLLASLVFYGAGFYIAASDGEPIPAFEYLRVPFYFVDVVACVLFLKLKPIKFQNYLCCIFRLSGLDMMLSKRNILKC